MKRAIFASSILVLSLAGAANAQTIQGLSDQLNADKAKLPALNQEMASAADDNSRLYKEYKVYVDDQKQKAKLVEEAIAREEAAVKAPIEAKIRAKEEAYNSQCAPERVGKLAPGPYQNCLALKAQGEQEVAALQQQWADYARQWNEQNVKPINDAIAKQMVRMKEIDTLMKANQKRFTDAQDAFDDAKSRIDENLAKMRRLCDPTTKSTADTPFTQSERMKWCSGIDFDGFDASLPPMYTNPGIGGVTPN
jgi:predicted  nucleic acid-binding Zn-ribbon protein